MKVSPNSPPQQHRNVEAYHKNVRPARLDTHTRAFHTPLQPIAQPFIIRHSTSGIYNSARGRRLPRKIYFPGLCFVCILRLRVVLASRCTSAGSQTTVTSYTWDIQNEARLDSEIVAVIIRFSGHLFEKYIFGKLCPVSKLRLGVAIASIACSCAFPVPRLQCPRAPVASATTVLHFLVHVPLEKYIFGNPCFVSILRLGVVLASEVYTCALSGHRLQCPRAPGTSAATILGCDREPNDCVQVPFLRIIPTLLCAQPVARADRTTTAHIQ